MPTPEEECKMKAKLLRAQISCRLLYALIFTFGCFAALTVYSSRPAVWPPPKLLREQSGTAGDRPLLLKTEYQLKDPIFAGALLQRQYLSTIGRTIHKTWASEREINAFNLFVPGKDDSSVEALDLPLLVEPANGGSGRYTERGDAGIGYCMKRALGVTCSASEESQMYFFHDMDGSAQRMGSIWEEVSNTVVSIFPVMSGESMQMIHLASKAKALVHLKQAAVAAETQLCQQKASVLILDNVCTRDPLPPPQHDVTPTFQPWQTITSNTVYSEDTELPAVRVSPALSSELNLLIANALYQINTQESPALEFKKLGSAMVRYNAATGREAILDIELWNSRNETLTRRVHFRRPPGDIISIRETDDYNATVHVIVPISNVEERFRLFLKSYLSSTRRQPHAKLILVVYGQEEFTHVGLLVAQYTRNRRDTSITILRGVGEFARGRAMDQGINILANNHLAFLCDVDITIDDDFWNRCRMNAIQGKRVYYPVFFSLYNMDYAYHNKIKPNGFWVSREHGHWVWYSYGMVCIYKSDYLASGGFDTSIVGWGGEDTDFFERVRRRAKLEVIKAPDPSLIHRWHSKHCSASLKPSAIL
eukprot:Em0438g2a